MDRLQWPSQRGLLQCVVRPGGRRSLRAHWAWPDLSQAARSFDHGGGNACALFARIARERCGSRLGTTARLRHQTDSSVRDVATRHGKLGVGDLRKYDFACQHDGEESGAISRKRLAFGRAYEDRTCGNAKTGRRRSQRWDAEARTEEETMIKKLIVVAASILAFTVAAPAARAEWPDHPIRFVVGFGPGGANDLIARFAAEGVSKRLGQPVVVENRPGAGAVIGTTFVAHSTPDGYTFLVGAANTITNSLILKDLPYADSDLVPVGMIAVAPSTIVVNPSVPANNMAEFVAWAKTQGDKGITWSTAGSGSTPHFVAEMVKEATGLNLTIVPYRSGSDGVNAVLSNSVSATSEASIVVLPQIKAGLLKAIA